MHALGRHIYGQWHVNNADALMRGTIGWHMFPSKVPFPWEYLDPHLIQGFLCPHDSVPQTAY